MNKENFNIDLVADQFEEYKSDEKQTSVFSYTGVFDEENLFLINRYIEFIQTLEPFNRRNGLFRVFVEVAQNINDNSTLIDTCGDRPRGCGTIAIEEREDCFILIASNPALKKDINKLKRKCTEINKKDESGLRELKKYYLKQDTGNRRNGNIGLVKMALISGNKIDVISKDSSQVEGYVSVILKINK